MVLLELKRIERIYQMGDERIPALDGIDLKIEAGEVVVLLGPSGSGKTTLLNVVSALDNPTGGEYFFEGEKVPCVDLIPLPVQNNWERRLGLLLPWKWIPRQMTKFKNSHETKKKGEEMTSFRRDNIGYVFQFFNLLQDLTAKENVLLVQELVGKRNEAEAERWLDLVGLKGLEDRYPTEMSGGQQQRVAIARSKAKVPKLLLGDELTGNLDTETSHMVMRTMVDVCRSEGITAIIVTHDAALAEYATRVIRMDSGKLVSDEPGGMAGITGMAKDTVKEVSDKMSEAVDQVKDKVTSTVDKVAGVTTGIAEKGRKKLAELADAGPE